MKTYLEAHRERLERNDKVFKHIAKMLKDQGCTVFAPKDQLINFIKVFRDGKHIVFGFEDMPHGWYLQMCLKPSKEHGSGRTILTKHGSENEITVGEILTNMKPNPAVKDFTAPSYLIEI